ncbi:MAG: hypothetical protein VX186_00550 [Nitrospinota bacterium]|nr:hypothetical protein [Nitrospinota bacterium]
MLSPKKNNLLSLGMQLHSLGIYDKAIEYLEEAQSLSNKLGHVGDEKHSLDLLGNVASAPGILKESLSVSPKFLSLFVWKEKPVKKWKY